MVNPPDPASSSPSHHLLANLRQDLMRYAPFGQMAVHDVDYFLGHAAQQYYAPGELVLAPQHGPVVELLFIRQGAVTGERSGTLGAFQYDAGDLFPVGAAMASRAVTATYKATADSFILALPRESMLELATRSPAFSDFLNDRIQRFLALSRQALQATYASQALAQQSLEKRLGDIATKVPVTCLPTTSLREALTIMMQRRIGSIIVVDSAGALLGILTRYDILGRVTLPGVPLDCPIREVMVSPVLSLTDDHTAQDAAMLMSANGIRHVPVTRSGQVIGVVSERDLFAIQRLSLKQISTALRTAADVGRLRTLASDIRRFAHSLLAQGVQARQLTNLISHLNDVLAERLVTLMAQRHGIALQGICWLALGSEGRGEQTIATDQDNALILDDAISASAQAAMPAFALAVNAALDECGYPLCKGGIMASEPACCMTLSQWRQRFRDWIEHGAPEDLLNASIFFDFRPVAGNAALAQALRDDVTSAACSVPRFLQQLALNALTHTVPLSWVGGIASDKDGQVDLKLQGTAVFVDAARIFALSRGTPHTGTRERIQAAGTAMGLAPSEYEAWIGGFEFIQMLRLRVQLSADTAPERPNHVRVADLNDIDRRILKESFRVGRAMQQRLQLDYAR
ncbi:MAG: CBS domain-containing protein [Rhodoferax sp.]|jgi:CBS domain-containing protein|nr:CBS domain-containing protein [Rhodoferax sp.]